MSLNDQWHAQLSVRLAFISPVALGQGLEPFVDVIASSVVAYGARRRSSRRIQLVLEEYDRC